MRRLVHFLFKAIGIFKAIGDSGAITRYRVLRMIGVVVIMAIVVGSVCAGFLTSIDRATQGRFDHPWLLFGLPFGGAAIGWLYRWAGGGADRGNALIIEQIHRPGGGVPWRMAPLIFVGTVVTHLFGGSAGREGTAVQIGGSIASGLAATARLGHRGRQIVMTAGIAAGFGAVFGTPLAGAVFALEVTARRRIDRAALIACLAAAVIADVSCRAWGIHHARYAMATVAPRIGALTAGSMVLIRAVLAGVAFGLVARGFVVTSHGLSAWSNRLIGDGPARPFVGGMAIIALVYAIGTRDYLGLGVWSNHPAAPTIAGFFTGPVDDHSWAWKLLFTVITVVSGFKGGEVTPLLFIGAALGNALFGALGGALGGQIDQFAAMGMVAVFASAANCPLAGVMMGAELFGVGQIVPIALACAVAQCCSGHQGLYQPQRLTARPAAL